MKAILPIVLLGVAIGAGTAGAADMPAFTVERWVNSPALTPDRLQGKVVLVDVWQYTCVNWIRTAPYVKAWHRDYADRGLVVVGLHAPEFEFGKRAEHIDRGIRDHGLTYPIPGPSGKAAVAVMLDGKPIGDARGADVGPDGPARFDRAGMIRLVARAPHGRHVLTLVASDPGLQVYVFTFGP